MKTAKQTKHYQSRDLEYTGYIINKILEYKDNLEKKPGLGKTS
jgi:hypothetical protein